MANLFGFFVKDCQVNQALHWQSNARDLLSKITLAPTNSWRSDPCFFGVHAAKNNMEKYEDDTILVFMIGSIYGCSNNVDFFASCYRKYGFNKAIGQLHGDFSIVLYEKHQQKIFLIRDKVGISPLYYSHNKDNKFIGFSTNPILLGVVPFIGFQPNETYVDLFATCHYRTIDNDRHKSPLEHVAQVPAAHYVEYHIKSNTTSLHCYWQVQEKDFSHHSEEELIEEYRHLFQQAVTQRLKKSHNQAFTLSGGMDSSSVLAMSSFIEGKPQYAFSSVYDDKTYDESEDIQSMLFGPVEKWNPVKIESINLFKDISNLVKMHGEPVATSTWLAHHDIARAVHEQGFDCLFGGLGGDEVNAGEYEYFFFWFADLHAAGKESTLAHEIGKWQEYHDHPIFIKNKKIALEKMHAMCDFSTLGRCLPDKERIRKYASTLQNNRLDIYQYTPQMPCFSSSYLNNRTWQDIFYETAPCCIRAEKRQTSYFGLETFLPFYDDRILDFMLNVESGYKIKNGVTKYLLREMMRGILPEETRLRVKKSGWNTPSHLWFCNESLDDLQDMIESVGFSNRDIYKKTEVKRLLKEHIDIVTNNKIQENHMMFFWQLVNVNLWLDWLDELKNKYKN